MIYFPQAGNGGPGCLPSLWGWSWGRLGSGRGRAVTKIAKPVALPSTHLPLSVQEGRLQLPLPEALGQWEVVPESPPGQLPWREPPKQKRNPQQEGEAGQEDVLCGHLAGHRLLAACGALDPATQGWHGHLPCLRVTSPAMRSPPWSTISGHSTLRTLGDTLPGTQPRGANNQGPSHTRGHTRAPVRGLGDPVPHGSAAHGDPQGHKSGATAPRPSGRRARAPPGTQRMAPGADRPCARCWRHGETAPVGGADI